MKKFVVILASALLFSGCASIQNAGNSLGDKLTRTATEQYIGQKYSEVASKRDWSIERKLIIGEPMGNKKLDNGNSVYYHEIRQVSPSTNNVFGVVSFGDKHVRYDYYAYLVSTDGIILDFAHKRTNRKFDHFALHGEYTSYETEGEEVDNEELEQVDSFITSKGKSISSWNTKQ
ncbi:MAG: hypothetical protein ACPGSN_08830 [Psychrobium sp.]|jgi:uncharacterized protein YceK|uniref:hypothetical protein n=1 Tax=Psychrobium sp. MM17-31 TaxID=2917758 RepID=UPI001EF3FCF8|nr:hypothetical protein [Psychrobium sp. MM17-31]MCG7533307.1 hypothetical protein [Psychrobium sp. MM17-31]